MYVNLYMRLVKLYDKKYVYGNIFKFINIFFELDMVIRGE